MIPLRALALIRDYRRHPWLPLLSVVGVALGVAVVVALDLAIGSARASMRDSAQAVAGTATHQIVGAVGPLDESLYARLRIEAGVRRASPLVEGFVHATELPDRPLRLLGVDPISEADFREFVTTARSESGAVSLVPAVPAVVIPRSVAQAARVEVGDTLHVRGSGQILALEVVGVFHPDDRLTREGSRDLLLTDLSVAQVLLDRRGRLDRIDLGIPDGDEGDRVLSRLATVLPVDVLLRPAGARADDLLGMTRAFELNLTALSLLALVFGVFLIYNAMTFSVVRRRERIGILRATGVTRREVLGDLLLEAAAIGLVGSAIGILAGIGLGRGLVVLVAQTVNDLYTFVQVDGLRVDGGLLAKGAILGMAATQIATLAPAMEAAGTGATQAMSRSVLERRTRDRVRQLAVLGLLAGGAAGIAFRLGPATLPVAFAGLALVMGAIALVTPWASTVLVRALAPAAGAVAGLSGRIAVRGVVRSMSRTGPALAALVVAVSVTVGLGAMIASFRLTVEQWLDHTLQADVYVSAASLGATQLSEPLDEELVRSVGQIRGLDALSTYRGLDILHEDGPLRLVALDLATEGEGAFRFLDGDSDEVLEAFRRGGAAMVSEPFAERTGVGRGSEVVLPTPAGDQSFPVAGVFFDYGSDRGIVMLSRATFDRHWQDARVTSLGLFARDGVPASALVDRVRALDGAEAVSVRSNRTLREVSLSVFDRTFTVTGVLRSLAFIVAFIGILGALMAIELERSREFGLLRASGLTPRGLWRLVLGETGLMGLMAGLLAVPAGALLAAVMVFVINKRAFGWTLELSLGSEIMIQSVLLGVLGAVVAGVYPAYRISRASAASVMRSE